MYAHMHSQMHASLDTFCGAERNETEILPTHTLKRRISVSPKLSPPSVVTASTQVVRCHNPTMCFAKPGLPHYVAEFI